MALVQKTNQDYSKVQNITNNNISETSKNTAVIIDLSKYRKQINEKKNNMNHIDNDYYTQNIQDIKDNQAEDKTIYIQPNTIQPETAPKSNIKTKRKAVNGKVNALRTPEQIQAVKDYFLNYDSKKKTNNKTHGIRNYCLFVFGLNTALRASDILMFTIGEVLDEDGNLRDKITIKEKKTSKKRDVYFNDTVKEAIRMYLETLDGYSLDDFLFPSNKKKWDEEKGEYVQQPITVRSFWRIMNQAGKDLGLDKENLSLGSHSCRKTFCRSILMNNADKPNMLIAVSEILNHASLKTTYTYADITADEQRELFMNNQL